MAASNIGPLLGSKVNISVQNRSTQFAKKAAITFLATTIIGTVVVFGGHGIIASVGSDMLYFGGIATVLTGAVFTGLYLARDRRQAKKIDKSTISESADKELKSYKKEVKLNGRKYEMEVIHKKKKTQVNLKHHK